MRTILTAILVTILAAPAAAQSRVVCDRDTGACSGNVGRQNFESQTGVFGNTTGTIGNRNFDIDAESHGQASGHLGGGTVSNRAARPSVTPGNVGSTQSRCYADGNGNTYCQ